MRMTGWTAEEVLGKPEQMFVNHVRPERNGAPGPLQAPCNSPRARGRQFGSSGAKTAPAFPLPAPARRSCATASSWERSSSFATSPQSRRKEKWEQSKNAIFSAIIAHHSLPSTMQLMADAFVALYPPKSIAIFVRAGDQFHIEAEAGLPPRPSPPMAGARPLARKNPRDDPRDHLDLGRTTVSGSRDGPCPQLPRVPRDSGNRR